VILFTDGAKGGVNKKMLAIAIALGTFATLSLAFQLKHVLDAFIWYHGPGGALEEMNDISNWVNVMQTVTYTFQTVIGDLVLVRSGRHDAFKPTKYSMAALSLLRCVQREMARSLPSSPYLDINTRYVPNRNPTRAHIHLIAHVKVCTCALIRVTSDLKVDGNIREKEIAPWLTSLLVLTMVQNLATSCEHISRLRDLFFC
jgi:hypothetical protein